MTGQRLSPQDVSFLHLESSNTHMHVASLMIFESAAAYEDVLDAIGRRLHLVPRFRQRLMFVPLNQERPVLVDDPHFNLRYHVRHTALPKPGTLDQLKALAGRIMSQQLDRTKPLWEIWLVDGLAGGRAATIAKTHHCLVDGVSAADLTAVLLDLERATPQPEPEPWKPGPLPTRGELLTDAIRERVTQPREMTRALRAGLRAPRRMLETGADFLAGIGALAWAGLNPAPPSPLNVPIGPHRRFELVATELPDFKAVKNALGGTINDVVLTVVTGALRRFLIHRGVDVRGLELRAMVPVSVRAEHEHGALGNRVSALIAPLPIYEPEAVRRLELIRDAMGVAKESKQVVGADMIMQLTGFASPTILSQAARLQSRTRFFNVLVTNVPGPQFPLYSVGQELQELYPIAPLSQDQALNVAVMSYNGKLGFGLLADYDALPDVGVVAEGVEKSLTELLGSAEPVSRPSAQNGKDANGTLRQKSKSALRVASPPTSSAD